MDTTLIESLRDPSRYPFPVSEVRVVETHISWVLLTGTFAYKIKKPVNLEFLDFSTLERREFFCREELRINTRLAPGLYLDVVPITGTAEAPLWDGPGPAIEFAVRMREFDSDDRLDAMLARNAVGVADMDQLAEQLADWHAHAPSAAWDSPYGTVAQVFSPAFENFVQMRAAGAPAALSRTLADIEIWMRKQHGPLSALIPVRKQRDRVRECHGDLHSRNIAVLDGRFVPFDALEFDPALRWIDVISELAFVIMDLDADRHTHAAHRLQNAYIEITADHDGVALLPFFLCYRAMVRAKVALLGARDADSERRTALVADCARYVALARHYTQKMRPALILMHGVSGSGKSTVSEHLVDALGALRVRSDFERKRLAREVAGVDLYSPEFGARTYHRLNTIATTVLDAGFTVILDATFVRAEQRAAALDVARQRNVVWLIIDCAASDAELRERVSRRARLANDISDADVAVLNAQLSTREPLTAAEREHTLTVDQLDTPALHRLAKTVAERILAMPG